MLSLYTSTTESSAGATATTLYREMGMWFRLEQAEAGPEDLGGEDGV